LFFSWSLPDYFVQKDGRLIEKILQTILPIGNISDKLNWDASMDGTF